jgi:hypothetical protein|tara:strand:+ start:47 stop:1396 length:1350 start_codon:yes stop_codon:yes gene_type:complete
MNGYLNPNNKQSLLDDEVAQMKALNIQKNSQPSHLVDTFNRLGASLSNTAGTAKDIVGRGVAAPIMGLPMDIFNLGARRPEHTGSSEWFGEQMQDKGIVSGERNPKLELLSGLLNPATAAKTAGLGLIPLMAGMTRNSKKFSDWDIRFDPRAKEQEKLKNLSTVVEERIPQDLPAISLPDLEGRPFITTMSDLTYGGGTLNKINKTDLNHPVNQRGGQNYMMDTSLNDGQVWASMKAPANKIRKMANQVKKDTGQNPILLPWQMRPTGSDFAKETGEVMLSMAQSNMGLSEKRAVDKALKSVIGNWKGLDNPKSMDQFRSLPKKGRDAIIKILDRDFRNKGGLGIGEARMALADPNQLTARTGGLLNVGEVFPNKDNIVSSHPSYSHGIAGKGLGVLEGNHGVASFLPAWAKARNIPDINNPSARDMRSLQMKPYSGIINDELLKKLGY